MSSDFFAIILMLGVLGIVTIAWRIRAESDKNKVRANKKDLTSLKQAKEDRCKPL